MPDNKIEITNPANDGGIIRKMYQIKVFSKSRELNLLQKLSEKKNKYFDEDLIKKLFNHYQICNCPNINKDLYLKNKYLYLTTRGVMNYLRLYQEQKTGVNKDYYTFEIKTVENYIKERLLTDSLSIISLGAANSDKEIQAFRELDEDQIQKIKYFPVDISNYLIHLGIINVSSVEKLKDLEVNSIIADFWDLADYISNNEIKTIKTDLFTNNKKVFLLLGGTFGNYTEKELLDTIIELMDVEDVLIISFKIKKPDKSKNISEEYDHPGDSEFLMEPLSYIPYFYGYTRYNRDFLVKGVDAELTDDSIDKKFVSVIPNSDCYAPYIEIKDKQEVARKLRLAWTTRYDNSELIEWLRTYRSNDNKGDFVFSYIDEAKEGDHALLFLKKEWVDYTEIIIKKLTDLNKSMFYGYKDKINNLSLEKKVELLHKIKNSNNQNEILRQIKKEFYEKS